MREALRGATRKARTVGGSRVASLTTQRECDVSTIRDSPPLAIGQIEGFIIMVMIWSPLMIDKLLNHLEEHKGRTGLYYVCAQEAFKSACKFLKEHYPSLTVTNLQIRNKLGNILSNGIDVSHACTEENGYKELYVHGRNILKQRYSSRSLQKEQAKTDSRKTRQQSSRDWDSSWRSSLLESQAGQTCISTPPFSKPTGDSSALTRSVANRDRR